MGENEHRLGMRKAIDEFITTLDSGVIQSIFRKVKKKTCMKNSCDTCMPVQDGFELLVETLHGIKSFVQAPESHCRRKKQKKKKVRIFV